MNDNTIKIAVCNQKGGVGKTTSCINIAGMLAKNYKKRVLLVDTDSQANLTKTMLAANIEAYEKETGRNWFDDHITLDTLLEYAQANKSKISSGFRKMVNEAIVKAMLQIRDRNAFKWRGIDVLPGSRGMAGVQVQGDNDMQVIISSIKGTVNRPYQYDYILFDMPPSMSDIVAITLLSCDYVLIPSMANTFSLEGIEDLVRSLDNIQENTGNETLQILGVFLTNYNKNIALQAGLRERMKDAFGSTLMDTAIRSGSAVSESLYLKRPLAWYRRTSREAQDYEALTKELLEKIGG